MDKRQLVVDWTVKSIQHEIDSTVQELGWRAESLAAELKRLSDGLKERPVSVYNSLGVVQGRGSEIDGLCRKLDALLREKARTDRLVRCLIEVEQEGG